jgi:putative oxidoreductase
MSDGRAFSARRGAWAALPLRLMFGGAFMYHGYPKLFTAEGHASIVGLLQNVGVPLPQVMSWVVGIAEFFGGLALVLGVLVPVAAGVNIITMIVAAVLVHLPHGFNFVNIVGQTEEGQPKFGMPGYEVNLLYIAGFLALIISGGGALSVDGMVKARRRRKQQ